MAWDRTGGHGSGVVMRDPDAGNDKTFVLGPDGDFVSRVPATVIAVYINYAGTATAGSRHPMFEVLDSDDNVTWQYRAGANMVAPATTAKQMLYATITGDTDWAGMFSGNYLCAPFPFVPLAVGHKFRVYDVDDIDAADVMTVNVHLTVP